MAIQSIQDVNLTGKRVLVRCDFNVPLKDGAVSDDSRIVAALPTIQHLMEQGARVVLCSHLGRPKGERKEEFSLAPVAASLAGKLRRPVFLLSDCIGPDVERAVDALSDGDVALLENVRFHAGETDNDPAFAAELAKLADAYVNDAFGTAHRAHASTAGVAAHLSPCVCGLLIEKELAYLGEKTASPERPFTVILGGAKVSDKIKVIDSLLEKADTIIIGGAMAYTFALAEGRKVGESLSEPDHIPTAQAALDKAAAKGVKFLLPLDNLAVKDLDFGAGTVGDSQYFEGNIEDGWEGVDIGPKSIELFKAEVAAAKTVLWNGPMGIFEIDACNKGTFAVAETIAQSDGTSIIGGGDSVKAIKMSGHSDNVTFMSTGGGASLEFLEGKTLPGIAALDQK
ncbi:MAG: phosphoglycerate kinase [Puniceicoccaceae bacterium MED-G30]|jgi:phosphoglycerate kinase|nr:MAG: phosphoglycerate kinase [Puniceicoccaceae bacterium MED-G30]RPG86008.1 MAG: phosphoglycerate kinase [Coraliomargarita sp. TMED73]|tara:strand:+ start:4600 stop:5793 length:1194 start_codon:yes stop_codon:yes gene_type:complete